MAGYLSSQEVIPSPTKTAIDEVTQPVVVDEFAELCEGHELSECPDCQGELTQYYDWDTIGYRCENCGTLINNQGFLMEES